MNRHGAEDAKLPEPDSEIDQIARINFNVCLLRQGILRVIRSC
jgi:hypothetical protein